jgi:integrase
MPLTDTRIRNVKPGEKPVKLFDEKGLFLLVTPTGKKWWRLKYRFAGKEKLISLGVYLDTGVKAARSKRDEARKLLANGIDPGEHRKMTRNLRAEAAANSFEVVAREWFSKYSPNWAPSHSNKIIRRLERELFPLLGKRPISEITAPELLRVLHTTERRGVLETAHRAKQNCGQVFRYAIATGRAERDPSAELRGALAPWKPEHYATLTNPKEVGQLLRAIDGYQGSPVTRVAMQVAPLVFVRPGELRRAEWRELDLDEGLWHIPAEKMKGRQPHIVPLSTQAMRLLREIQMLTGNGQYVFPGARTRKKPMSENAINAALRAMGYDRGTFTGHGFRSMASTLLHEHGWPSDVIERQLAHAERNNVKAAYNRAEHLPERKKMMQQWADYLDDLKSGAKVVTIRSSA